jgi:ketosteroid isomerase-like protein
MKKTKTTCLLMASLLFGISSNVQAQNTDAASAYQKEYIKENPTADQDVKMVEDYLNAVLVSGDLEKAKSFLADNFKGFGPGINDSVTAEQAIANRKEELKLHMNRKVNFVANTWLVTEGNYKGNWVAIWGEYDFTISGKDLRVPFQSTAHVTNGKIDYSISYWDNLSPSLSAGYTLTPPKQN